MHDVLKTAEILHLEAWRKDGLRRDELRRNEAKNQEVIFIFSVLFFFPFIAMFFLILFQSLYPFISCFKESDTLRRWSISNYERQTELEREEAAIGRKQKKIDEKLLECEKVEALYEDVQRKFTCPICLHHTVDSQFRCHHLYCHACATKIVETIGRCSLCWKKVSTVYPLYFS